MSDSQAAQKPSTNFATVPATSRPPRLSRSAVFVWAVWALLLAADLGFVWSYGVNVPHWDDWSMVPVLTGHEPITPQWLWTPNNEHRIPLPKLAYLALVRGSGYDWRSGMVASVLCLGILSAGLIVAVRRRRGCTLFSDALFALVLQHVGQWQNLLWCFQIGFVLGVLLVGAILMLLVVGGDAPGKRHLAGVAVCLMLLPLCGANSLAFVPSMALWLGYAGWQQRSGGRWWLLCAAAALGLTGLYFVGIEKIPTGAVPKLSEKLITTAQFLSTASGTALSGDWPLGAAIVIALAVGTAAFLLRAWWQRPGERVGAMGLLLLMGGFAVLALGVGWGRAGLKGAPGLENRYVTLSAPLICVVYCACGLYLPARRGRFGQAILCLAMAVMLVPNTIYGRQQGRTLRAALDEVTRDAHDPTISTAQMAHKYTRGHHTWLWADHLEDELRKCLEYLKEDQRGPFR